MNQNLESEMRSLASGVKAVVLVFMLIVAYLNIRMALRINSFTAIFDDMLGDKPLPWNTTVVVKGEAVLRSISLLLPLAAIVVIFTIRNHKMAFFSVAGLMLLAFLQMHFTLDALFAPLMNIISSMGATTES